MRKSALAGAVLILSAALAPAAAPVSADEAFLAALREVMMHDHVDIRDGAWILRTSGLDVAATVKDLTAVLRASNPDHAVAAAGFLAEIGPGASAAVPALTDAVLYGRDIDLRYSCAVALGRIGPAAGAAAIPLIGALKDENPYMRGAAAAALGRIGAGSAIVRKALEGTLSDQDPEVRFQAQRALESLGNQRR